MAYYIYEGQSVSGDHLMDHLSYFANKTKNVDKILSLLHAMGALTNSELHTIKSKKSEWKQGKIMYTIVCNRWEKTHGDLVDAYKMTDNHKLITKLSPFPEENGLKSNSNWLKVGHVVKRITH